MAHPSRAYIPFNRVFSSEFEYDATQLQGADIKLLGYLAQALNFTFVYGKNKKYCTFHFHPKTTVFNGAQIG